MKKLRDVPPRYRVAALVFGGISLFLFGVVFALVQRAYRVAASPAWPAWLIGALGASVVATGAVFALLALGVLSDPKSRLGSRVHDKVEGALDYLCIEVLVQGGFILFLWAGSYSIYLGAAVGAAVLLCWVLFFVLIERRERKLDVRALDDPDGNPRATERIAHPRAVAASIAIIGAFLIVAGAGIVIANHPLHKVALVPPTKLPATIATARDAGVWITRPGPSWPGTCEILFPKGQGAVPGVNCRNSGGKNSDLK